MRTGLTAAIDRRLASFIRDRASRKSVVLRLLPAGWIAPLLTQRVRRLRIRLAVAILAFSLLIAAASLYLAFQA